MTSNSCKTFLLIIILSLEMNDSLQIFFLKMGQLERDETFL